MKHFDPTQLADYTRGTAQEIELATMRQHLESGCGRCNRLVSAFERVLGFAQSEAAAPQPPEYAVRAIKAFFGLDKPETQSIWQKLRLAPSFDSTRAQAAVGVRSLDTSSRRITYETGQYLVELTIEQPEAEPDGLVAGHLLSQQNGPILPMAEIPAFLMSQGQLQATALTSDLGEFSLAGGLDGECELWFFPDSERVIGVTWDQDSDITIEH